MKPNTNQIILYCFAVGFIGVAVFFMIHDANGLASLSLIGALLLILVAAVDPKTIQNLGFRRGDRGTEFGIIRYTPPPQEVEEALALGSSDTDTPIA
ncbi:MAG: hypothetical protein IIB42_10160, partial [Candidatus Marinimicrobia bacterium]|nr:hypothetical protein [Candidatus Neomarinimicrobiota bacterium]